MSDDGCAHGACDIGARPGPEKRPCPRCGRTGHAVGDVTLQSLVAPDRRPPAGAGPYHFCATPDCPVVYYAAAGGAVLERDALIVRVGVKETEEPIPLCYCFGWTRARIAEEIERTGGSTAAARITEDVRAGRCHCEDANPSGRCCLGTVSKAVKELQGARGQTPSG